MIKINNNFLKFFVTSLILSQYLTISTFAQVNLFSDVKGHWSQSEIDIFIKNGYIQGYEDLTFRPDLSITRAEFITIVNKVLGFKKVGKENFGDINKDQWFYEQICIAIEAGYIQGYEDNTFKPNNFITREEVASILTSIKKNKDENIDKSFLYWDNKEISNWAKSSVEGALENGYMGGYGDITFRPKNNITRAESVVVLNRLLTGNKIELPNNELFKPIFSYSDVPSSIKNKMLGLSMPSNIHISFDELSYLKLSYYGFDDKYHIGEMVVNKKIAKEVVDIFKELLDHKYPIEKIKLIDDYKADDNLSMADNNSSSFCYRAITNGNSLSKHSLGLAIDINPVQNPYVAKNQVLPSNGSAYLNRNYVRKGMIVKNDVCYNAFAKRGWTWGGNWKSLKDYQHFEKNL